MSRSAPALHIVVLVPWLSTVPALLGAESEPPRIVGERSVAGAALAAVDAYHRLDTEYLAPRLSDDFRFADQDLGQDLDGPGFLAKVAAIATDFTDRETDVQWVGVMPSGGQTSDGDRAPTVDVRGRWRAVRADSDRKLDRAFSIRLELELGLRGEDQEAGEVRILSWNDVFRPGRRLYQPVAGDGRHLSEHFDIRFLTAEFDAGGAARLASLAETWYRRTAEYLGRDFEGGRQVLLDVASVHEIPYASAPGPDAFFLISVEQAEDDYGFSLVHELTHNLVGLSRLSRSSHADFPDGNRLFDEGFGVYVEEKLATAGRVFPNFGQEVHAAYLQLHGRLGVPRPPVLEAERLRRLGRDETRLAYLQQASFVKWLLETAPGPEADDGLERFLKLFERGLDALPELYGRDLAQLEKEWLAFLDGLSNPS